MNPQPERDRIALPLKGTPCAVCALPAAFLTVTGRVFHTATTGKPPCHTQPSARREVSQ